MISRDIELAAELAGQAFLRKFTINWVQAEEPGGSDRVYCGLEGIVLESETGEPELIRLPCIIVSCQSAEPVLPRFHGNWNTNLRFEIHSNAGDTTGQQHAARVSQISSLLYTSSVARDLSLATPDFFVAWVAPGGRGYEIRDRRWVSYLELGLYSASPTTIQQ